MENLTWNLISMKFTKKLFFLSFLTLAATVFFEPSISLAGPITDTYNAGTSVNELQQQAGKPTNRIKIPGITYSNIKEVKEDGDTYLYVPYIGEYLSVVYRYLVVIAGLVAVIVIIIAGIQWTASGGNSSSIESAKNRIVGALTGLGLAVGSYIILYTINPELVNFRSLKIKYIPGVPVEVTYDEGEDPTAKPSTGGYLGGNPKPSGKAKCIYEKFTPNIKVGEKPPIRQINLLGMGRSIPVNSNSYDAWKKASDEILASQDPEVLGYLQYMRDFRDKKVPDLLGEKDGAGVVSQSLGKGIGISRATGAELGSLIQDMHVMGLAVDFMTRSNWDINWGGTKKGKAASGYCENYKKTLTKMKNGDYGEQLKSDPYKMYERLDKKIEHCMNKFDNGNDPFTSIPQGMIDIFVRNGFYWGGYGWGNKMRSDAMHFEYWGGC